MRSSSFLLTFRRTPPKFQSYILHAQGASLVQSVSPILSDPLGKDINCEDPERYRLMTQVIDGETITSKVPCIIHVPSGYQEAPHGGFRQLATRHRYAPRICCGCDVLASRTNREVQMGWVERFGERRELLCGLPSSGLSTGDQEDTYWSNCFNGGGRACSAWTTSIFLKQLIEHIDEEFSLDLSGCKLAGTATEECHHEVTAHSCEETCLQVFV